MADAPETNKIVGTMFTNDPDGVAADDKQHGLPGLFTSKGFEVHDLGLYPPLSDDFSSQITDLKKANAEIVCGIFNPPQFAIFWTQCAQQGYRPKIVTPPKALLFPTAVEALGNRGSGMSTEVWWSHHHPFKSGLTGETAQQFCDSYEAATGKQWTQPLGFKHANLEVAIDVLKRTKKARAGRDPRCDRPDGLRFDRRSDLLERRRPHQSGAERLHDAAGRRTVEEGQEVQVRSGSCLQQERPEHSAGPPVRSDQVFLMSPRGLVSKLHRRSPNARGRYPEVFYGICSWQPF